MANKLKITFLGTAANGGVPQADCRCSQCSGNIVRLRSCLLLQFNNQNWVVDAGPDFKRQLESHHLKITDLSGIIISHLHADHCIGLSELGFGKSHNVPMFSHPAILKELRNHQMFGFLFNLNFATTPPKPKWLHFCLIPHDPNFTTTAIVIQFRNRQILIATDIAKFSQGFIKLVLQSDLVVIDGTFLHQSMHWHQSIEQTCKIVKGFTKKLFFTHINHSENPQEINSFVSKFNFGLAHDNLTLEI